MKVGFFGSIAEKLGREHEFDDFEGSTVADLRAFLAAQLPDAEDLITSPTVRACVDDIMVADSAKLGAARRVEFFPTLSGG